VFGAGSYGIELGGLSRAQGQGVVLVDMEAHGQARTKWSELLKVGMKLMEVNGINVSGFELNQVIELMSGSERPVTLSWKDQAAQRIVTIKK